MYTLGSKAVVINDAALITVSGSILSIPGFGQIDNTDPAYSKTKTTGVAPTFSSVDTATLPGPGIEVAIYWLISSNRPYHQS